MKKKFKSIFFKNKFYNKINKFFCEFNLKKRKSRNIFDKIIKYNFLKNKKKKIIKYFLFNNFFKTLLFKKYDMLYDKKNVINHFLRCVFFKKNNGFYIFGFKNRKFLIKKKKNMDVFNFFFRKKSKNFSKLKNIFLKKNSKFNLRKYFFFFLFRIFDLYNFLIKYNNNYVYNFFCKLNKILVFKKNIRYFLCDVNKILFKYVNKKMFKFKYSLYKFYYSLSNIIKIYGRVIKKFFFFNLMRDFSNIYYFSKFFFKFKIFNVFFIYFFYIIFFKYFNYKYNFIFYNFFFDLLKEDGSIFSCEDDYFLNINSLKISKYDLNLNKELWLIFNLKFFENDLVFLYFENISFFFTNFSFSSFLFFDNLKNKIVNNKYKYLLFKFHRKLKKHLIMVSYKKKKIFTKAKKVVYNILINFKKDGYVKLDYIDDKAFDPVVGRIGFNPIYRNTAFVHHENILIKKNKQKNTRIINSNNYSFFNKNEKALNKNSVLNINLNSYTSNFFDKFIIFLKKLEIKCKKILNVDLNISKLKNVQFASIRNLFYYLRFIENLNKKIKIKKKIFFNFLKNIFMKYYKKPSIFSFVYFFRKFLIKKIKNFNLKIFYFDFLNIFFFQFLDDILKIKGILYKKYLNIFKFFIILLSRNDLIFFIKNFFKFILFNFFKFRSFLKFKLDYFFLLSIIRFYFSYFSLNLNNKFFNKYLKKNVNNYNHLSFFSLSNSSLDKLFRFWYMFRA
jgi:hypothetical protein